MAMSNLLIYYLSPISLSGYSFSKTSTAESMKKIINDFSIASCKMVGLVYPEDKKKEI